MYVSKKEGNKIEIFTFGFLNLDKVNRTHMYKIDLAIE